MGDRAGRQQLHTSVLLAECLQYLQPVSGGLYVDGTMGLGGHTEALLEQTAPDGRVIAFEWDSSAIEHASHRLARFGDRLQIVRSNFAELVPRLGELNVQEIDGLLLDIGLSSLQLDQGKRGFSFRFDESLDMRMDDRRQTTAATIINTASEQELADIFYYFGEEKQARPIAAAIVAARRIKAIATTGSLADIVAQAVPKRFHPQKIHVATKVFQALRIAVNTELENLARILDEVATALRPRARVCVISFHSLEDRIVKRKFRKHPELQVITTKPVIPSSQEVALNARARSARLRVAEKIYVN